MKLGRVKVCRVTSYNLAKQCVLVLMSSVLSASEALVRSIVNAIDPPTTCAPIPGREGDAGVLDPEGANGGDVAAEALPGASGRVEAGAGAAPGEQLEGALADFYVACHTDLAALYRLQVPNGEKVPLLAGRRLLQFLMSSALSLSLQAALLLKNFGGPEDRPEPTHAEGVRRVAD